MTVAAEPSAAPTVVLLAEPGAGRARRLMLALHGLGVAPAAVDEPETDADAADEEEPDSAASPSLDLGALHEQALDAAGVRADDARPTAWADAAGAVSAEMEGAVSAWLERQLSATASPLVADRRLHWHLPVWVRACEELGVRVAVVVAVRRPDLASEQLTDPPGRRELAGAAAWLNQALHVERATRGLPRVIVPAEEVADDWVAATARIGEALDLETIRDAPATIIRATQQALDRAPATAIEPREPIALPPRLQEQVGTVWALLMRLAGGEADASAAYAELDAARTAYAAFYLEAESVAISSVRAARARRAAKEAPAQPAAPEAPEPTGSRLPWRRQGRSEGS